MEDTKKEVSNDMKDFLKQNPNSNTGIELRFFASDIEKERVFKSQHFRPPHIRAASTLVAPIGVMWEPGAWQKTVDMVIASNQRGVCTWLHEMVDINAGIPAKHLNIMRDSACMYAHDAGFEWVMIIENDALPDEDLLINLLKWDMPVVVPYITDDILGKPICAPFYKPNTGLHPVSWSVFTCMLINTRVLNCFPFAQPFDTVGIESGLFNKLRHYGHKVYQDTNTKLEIARRPSYPVDYGGLEAEWKAWIEIDKKRRQIPNRSPIDPNDTRQVNGIYMGALDMGNISGIKGDNDADKSGAGKESNPGEIQPTDKTKKRNRKRNT